MAIRLLGGDFVGSEMTVNRLFDLLNLSNVGDFSWSLIHKDFIQVQKEKGNIVFVCLRPR